MTVQILAVARPCATLKALIRRLDALHRRYVERRTLSALARLDAHLPRVIALPNGAATRAMRRMPRRCCAGPEPSLHRPGRLTGRGAECHAAERVGGDRPYHHGAMAGRSAMRQVPNRGATDAAP